MREQAVGLHNFTLLDVMCPSSVLGLVPEPNELMRNSYLILDENMCFLNCQGGSKTPSESLLTVGVEKALAQSGSYR